MKINLNKIKIGKKGSWQNGIFIASLISLGIFALAVGYLFIRPLNADVSSIIDTEISAINVYFDTKTIDMVTKRLELKNSPRPAIGKNPFIPF